MLKKTFKYIDNLIFGGAVRFKLEKHKENRLIKQVRIGMEHKIISLYQKNHDCEIAALCDKYGSDKGALREGGHPYPWPSHTYSDFYSRLFWHCRDNVRNVFECGLGTNNPNLPSSMGISGKPGASLRVWRDYFPNAMVYGADVDKDILFEENRIKTFYIDQLDPNTIKSFWDNIEENEFDFMVDDGLHTFEAGSNLFKFSIDRLAKRGIYVIEDVSRVDLLRYQEFFRDKNYAVEYVLLFKISEILRGSNLVVVRKK